MPRQPLGKTFMVAISLLGIFAAAQLLAVAWYFVPVVRHQIQEASLRSAAQATEAATTQVSANTPAPVQVASAPAQPQAPAYPNMQKVQGLLVQANSSFAVGDYDAAAQVLQSAEALSPGNPEILWRKSLVLERMGQYEDAIEALEGVMNAPTLQPQARLDVQKRLDNLMALASSAQPKAPRSASSTAAAAAPDGDAQSLREDGLQPGSDLGIIDVRMQDTKPGEQTAQVSVKSRTGATIDPKEVHVQVYFYEQTADGDILPTDYKPPFKWLSPPIDWAGNEPELLEVTYKMPETGSDRKYFGYAVGVYYKDDLQDFRTDPAKIAHDFPLPLKLPK